MAVIDVAGFVSDLKDHAIGHGFHVHDERHFVETYSLRQTWEVDLHPEEACQGPIDLHLALDIDPRALLGFEDAMASAEDPEADPPDGFTFPLHFTWMLPPLPQPPDLLVLATEVAGIGGLSLPVEVAAIDTIPSRHRRAGAEPVDRRSCQRLPGPGVPGRGGAVRHPRPLPRRQPLPVGARGRVVG